MLKGHGPHPEVSKMGSSLLGDARIGGYWGLEKDILRALAGRYLSTKSD